MELVQDVSHGTWDYPFEVHRTDLGDGLSLYPHVHSELEITAITKGEGQFFINNQEFLVKEGDVLFIPSENIHLATSTNRKPAAYFSIVFSPECFSISRSNRIYSSYISPVLENKVSFAEYLDGSEDWHRVAFELAREIDEYYQLSGRELLCQSSLLKLWSLYFDHSTPGVSKPDLQGMRIKATIDYMHHHFQESLFIKDLSHVANMSEGHYSRTFKGYMKISPLDYLIRLRIDESIKLLQSSSLSIGEIALCCGFNDFSYFGKCFKRRMNCSPKDYRKSACSTLLSDNPEGTFVGISEY